jgi:hypothetical protein
LRRGRETTKEKGKEWEMKVMVRKKPSERLCDDGEREEGDLSKTVPPRLRRRRRSAQRASRTVAGCDRGERRRGKSGRRKSTSSRRKQEGEASVENASRARKRP